jgi:hypothetical protein
MITGGVYLFVSIRGAGVVLLVSFRVVHSVIWARLLEYGAAGTAGEEGVPTAASGAPGRAARNPNSPNRPEAASAAGHPRN